MKKRSLTPGWLRKPGDFAKRVPEEVERVKLSGKKPEPEKVVFRGAEPQYPHKYLPTNPYEGHENISGYGGYDYSMMSACVPLPIPRNTRRKP